MAGGPIAPYSAFPVTAGNCFPNVYVGGGANSKHEEGLGVAASIGADSTWRLRFRFPEVIPSGTAKIELWALANASTGVAKITVKDADVAPAASPSAATLTSETQISMDWSSGAGVDQYKVASVAITPTPVAGDILVCDLVFNTASWTLAQVSTWWPWLIWV
jgi:hypothetical protein